MLKHITDVGKASIANLIAARKEVVFTRFAVGSGTVSTEAELKALTDIKDHKIDYPIYNVKSLSGVVTLQTNISNDSIDTAINITELGIFGLNDIGDEVLMFYIAYEEASMYLETKEVAGIIMTPNDVDISFNGDEVSFNYVPTLDGFVTRVELKNEIDALKTLLDEFMNADVAPVPVGGIFLAWDSNLNPAVKYPGTAWTKMSAGTYLRTGNIGLSRGGRDTFTLTKNNLPYVKLATDAHAHTPGSIRIQGWFNGSGLIDETDDPAYPVRTTGAFYYTTSVPAHLLTCGKTDWNGINAGFSFDSSRSISGQTSSSTPYTEHMGLGHAVSINPSYLDVIVWCRTL